MTLLFLVVLATAWGIVFLPAVRRAKESSPYPSTRTFKRAMYVVSPRTPCGRWANTPGRRAPDRSFILRQQRLQRTFATGLIAVGVSALAAITAGGGWVEFHLAVDGLMCGYVAWLLEDKRRRTERASKVRPIRQPATPLVFLSEDLRTGT